MTHTHLATVGVRPRNQRPDFGGSIRLVIPGTGRLSVATATMVGVPPLLSSPAAFVGRAEELSALVQALGVGPDQHAASAPAKAILLAGDAGVGKTRLLTELRDRCLAAGWDVLAGHCLDFDAGLPYLPFSEVIGHLVGNDTGVFDAVAADHPALGRLRPGRRLLGVGESTDDDSAAVGRGALYDGVHALLAQLGAERPVLLVVEDAHWADASTRDLLSFLFARPFASPVAFVVSYRSDDLHRRHPLRRAVAEWARIPGVSRSQLEPLPPSDVRRLVAQLHPAPIGEPSMARIIERADGNAFFVEELVGAAGTTRGLLPDLPEDLADLLMVRLDGLSDAGSAVVRTAAVAGRQVRHELLAAVSGLAEDRLEEGLRDAVEHNVLVPGRDDAVAFRHALLAEAVYDDLLPGERTRLHAAYAAALGEGRVPGTAAELARHARLAHQTTLAIDASVRAGDEAMSVGGPIEAARHYEEALDLLSREAGADVDVAVLGQRAVEALVAAGNPPRALALAEQLLADLPPSATPEQRGQLRLAATSTVMVAETRRDGTEFSGPALQELPTEPSPLRARLLHAHGRAQYYASQVSGASVTDARAVVVEALGMASSLNLPRLASEIQATLAGFERDGDAPPERVEQSLENAARTAAQTGATTAELRALWLIGRWHYDRGNWAASRDAFQRTYALAERIGAHWAPYGFDARFASHQIAYLTGDWDGALALADVSGQAPPPIPEAILAAGELTVRAGRGETEALAVVPWLQERWDGDGMIAVTAGPAAVELYAQAGDVDAALRQHDAVVETMQRLWRQRFAGRVRLAAVTAGAVAGRLADASAQERSRLAGLVGAVLDGGEATLRIVRENDETWGPEGIAWAARLEAERLRLGWLSDLDAPPVDDLVTAWRADHAAFTTLGHVFETARAATRLATVLHAAGQDAESATYAQSARVVAERLGAAPLLAELRGLSPVQPSAGRVRVRHVLTPRESEIMRLVAAGRSNGEIARQLFIATKTASVHVSNILAKLGAGSRTEAAAIARREGLLED